MSRLLFFLSAFLCVPLRFQTVFAQDARNIIEEAQRRSRAPSRRNDGVLQVHDARGKTTEKRWRVHQLGSYGNSKTVLRFTAPPEVKGVALLVVNHPDRSSDQWMWTPSIARERRIAIQDRATRFFGTDFTFEDLEERDVGQFDWKLLGEDAVDGALCWRIEGRPKEKKVSQYTSTLLWIRRDNYVGVRYENYKKDQLVRRLHLSDLERIQGIWTPRRWEMSDVARNSRTILRTENLQYNVPLKDEDFTLQALRREQ